MGSELFGSTKQKLDLPFGVDCYSHGSDKMNYFISRPNTHRAKRSCVEESLNYGEHDVAHTTFVLEDDRVADDTSM